MSAIYIPTILFLGAFMLMPVTGCKARKTQSGTRSTTINQTLKFVGDTSIPRKRKWSNKDYTVSEYGPKDEVTKAKVNLNSSEKSFELTCPNSEPFAFKCESQLFEFSSSCDIESCTAGTLVVKASNPIMQNDGENNDGVVETQNPSLTVGACLLNLSNTPFLQLHIHKDGSGHLFEIKKPGNTSDELINSKMSCIEKQTKHWFCHEESGKSIAAEASSLHFKVIIGVKTYKRNSGCNFF